MSKVFDSLCFFFVTSVDTGISACFNFVKMPTTAISVPLCSFLLFRRIKFSFFLVLKQKKIKLFFSVKNFHNAVITEKSRDVTNQSQPAILPEVMCHIMNFKGHWQQKISTFYVKVFDLNRQNVVVWCYENAPDTF